MPDVPATLTDELVLTRVDDLILHPKNPNEGDVGAVAESIRVHGFYAPIVAQRSTSYVLAGNHRLTAARQLGYESVPTVWVDVDDETALRILLVDNAVTRTAKDDLEMLVELLDRINNTEAGLTGTGYDTDDFADVVAQYRKGATEYAPDEFPLVNPEALGLTHTCPQCGYRF